MCSDYPSYKIFPLLLRTWISGCQTPGRVLQLQGSWPFATEFPNFTYLLRPHWKISFAIDTKRDSIAYSYIIVNSWARAPQYMTVESWKSQVCALHKEALVEFIRVHAWTSQETWRWFRMSQVPNRCHSVRHSYDYYLDVCVYCGLM